MKKLRKICKLKRIDLLVQKKKIQINKIKFNINYK